MKPARFIYLKPLSLVEAVEMLEAIEGDIKVLAGGQSLLPLMNMRLATPTHLIDINGLEELDRIDTDDGNLRIGALTRQRTAELSEAVRAGWPLLTEALGHIGHVQIRHRGTVGGNLAHADPASELPAVALALDAVMVLQSTSGTRRVAAADFFESLYATAMEPAELLAAVEVPAWPAGRRAAFEEFARRRGDFALAAAAVTVDVEDGAVRAGCVALAGVAPTPVRCRPAEERLQGLEVGDRTGLIEMATIAADSVDPGEDVEATAEFRRSLVRVLVQRALVRALA